MLRATTSILTLILLGDGEEEGKWKRDDGGCFGEESRSVLGIERGGLYIGDKGLVSETFYGSLLL